MKLLMVLVYTISVVDNEGHYIRFALYLMFMTSNYSESRIRKYVYGNFESTFICTN